MADQFGEVSVVGTIPVESSLTYIDLNAMINLWGSDKKLQLDKDKLAARKYFLDHVNQNTVFFHTLKERLGYLVENEYYEKEDGTFVVSPLPEMKNVHWIEDMGFEDLEVLDFINESEYLRIKEALSRHP
mgnify:CR=1 FL=1